MGGTLSEKQDHVDLNSAPIAPVVGGPAVAVPDRGSMLSTCRRQYIWQRQVTG